MIPISSRLMRLRNITILTSALTALSFLLAIGFRFDFEYPYGRNLIRPLAAFTWPLAALICLRTLAYQLFDLHRRYWRYVSVDEALAVFKAHLFSTLLLLSVLLCFGFGGFPRSILFIELAISVPLSLGTFLLIRLYHERFRGASALKEAPNEAVVIGAGVRGHSVVKLAASQATGHKITAVFDDDDQCQGMKAHGVPIVGPISSLGGYLAKHPRVSMVNLAILRLPESKRREIESACSKFNVPLKQLPSIGGIMAEDFKKHSAVKSPVEELLGRDVRLDPEEDVAAEMEGKSVLITGAGGSIGSELVRQVLEHEPLKLVLVDQSEYNLYAIGQELAENDHPQTKVIECLADITNGERLAKIFRRHQPDIVFHAAAYKHVPLLENNSYEAFRNNILGTMNVLAACRASRSQRIVFISTDKAVEPKSIMGCTKRICEMMVQQINSAAGKKAFPQTQDHRLETAVVRFGNVINSAGSVIPLFTKQILTGSPITVTHERVNRYFMSIQEAAGLVLTAGMLGRNGEIFMLDMGKPLNILKVAERLRAAYGRRDLPINIVGLRPGEKLDEQLYYSEDEIKCKTGFEKIFAVRSKNANGSGVFQWARELSKEVEELDDGQILDRIRNFLDAGTIVPFIPRRMRDQDNALSQA